MASAVHSVNPKAEAFEKAAQKMASKFDWFGTSREQNQESAAELYTKAATQYKISKDFMKAGECYEKAALCSMAAGNTIESNQAWREAGKSFAKVDSTLAIRAYKHAIEHYKDADRFSQAARLHEEVAKLLEEEGHVHEAIEQYEECADLFETDSDQTNANKRYLVIAHLSAKCRKYARAVELFEKVAKHNLDNHLLRWNVKGLLFKSLFCVINDMCIRDDPKLWATLEAKLEKYRGLSDLFATSREAAYCQSLVEAVPTADLDKFKEAFVKFDTIQKLEAWHNDQLLHMEVYITDKRDEAPVLDGASAAADFGAPPAYARAPDFGVPTTLSSAADAPTDLSSAPDLL